MAGYASGPSGRPVIFRIVAIEGVIVGRIAKIRPHPDGVRIWLADLDIGTDYQPQIVWGGEPVVAEGDLVPVAPPGARLPVTAGKRATCKIRRRRYRGETSEGMLCSLAELGWDLSVTDRVALLENSAGLKPGDSLDDVGSDWKLIVRPDTGFLESPEFAVAEPDKVLQTA
jgi:phenylalanyl-tRNA synthetase beta chain